MSVAISISAVIFISAAIFIIAYLISVSTIVFFSFDTSLFAVGSFAVCTLVFAVVYAIVIIFVVVIVRIVVRHVGRDSPNQNQAPVTTTAPPGTKLRHFWRRSRYKRFSRTRTAPLLDQCGKSPLVLKFFYGLI